MIVIVFVFVFVYLCVDLPDLEVEDKEVGRM